MNQPNYPWSMLKAVRSVPAFPPQRGSGGWNAWRRRFNLFNVAFFGLLFLTVAFMMVGQTADPEARTGRPPVHSDGPAPR